MRPESLQKLYLTWPQAGRQHTAQCLPQLKVGGWGCPFRLKMGDWLDLKVKRPVGRCSPEAFPDCLLLPFFCRSVIRPRCYVVYQRSSEPFHSWSPGVFIRGKRLVTESKSVYFHLDRKIGMSRWFDRPILCPTFFPRTFFQMSKTQEVQEDDGHPEHFLLKESSLTLVVWAWPHAAAPVAWNHGFSGLCFSM